MKRRQWLLGALGALATARLAAEPRFTVDEFEWADEARQRAVPVRLYRPAVAEGAVPLVVFSHGIGGSRRGYRYLGEHWAGHGIASLHVQHVGSDRAVWGGNPFAVVERLRSAAGDGEALARVQDLRFALDTALAQLPGLDTARIAVAGHSYGANTAMLAAGARVARAPATLRDERFKAALLISAPPFYGEPALAPILQPLDVPTLHVTSVDDWIRIPGYGSGPDDRVAVFEATGSRRKWLAVFSEGNHSSFVGRAEGSRLVAATRELALAFTQQVFELPGADFDGWRQRHGALVERFVSRT